MGPWRPCSSPFLAPPSPIHTATVFLHRKSLPPACPFLHLIFHMGMYLTASSRQVLVWEEPSMWALIRRLQEPAFQESGQHLHPRRPTVGSQAVPLPPPPLLYRHHSPVHFFPAQASLRQASTASARADVQMELQVGESHCCHVFQASSAVPGTQYGLSKYCICRENEWINERIAEIPVFCYKHPQFLLVILWHSPLFGSPGTELTPKLPWALLLWALSRSDWREGTCCSGAGLPSLWKPRGTVSVLPHAQLQKLSWVRNNT